MPVMRLITLLLVWSASALPCRAQPNISKNPLGELSGSIRELTNRIAPAVVEVIVTGYATGDDDDGQAANPISKQRASGSGVVVDPEGYIMTNAHLVRGVVEIKVLVARARLAKARGDSQIPRTRSLDARVIGFDRESDLALIKVDAQGLPVLRFGDSDKVHQGDLVFAVGSPFGLRNSVSMGVVSAPARALNDDNPILYIQTDASINPGNSGGALVDTSGSLVGLNTMIVSRSGGNEGVGFAIPSNVVRNVYHQLRTKGRVARGSIGISVQDITPVMAQGLGLPLERGVVVVDLDAEGPADRAGLKTRDVILSVNGQQIETARQLQNDIFRRQGGEKIMVAVQRGDYRLNRTLEVRAQSEPWDPAAALASPEKNLVARLGILCLEIDQQLAEQMPGLRRPNGLVVAAKAPEGQNQFVDLEPGDIIHAINNLPIVLLDVFQSTVRELAPGAPVVLEIERDGHFRYVAFQIE
jgi:serine protease Do